MIRILKVLPIFLVLATTTHAQKSIEANLATFAAQTGATTTIDKATNGISFMRFPAGKGIKLSGKNAQERALNFMGQHNNLFAVGKLDLNEYQVKESTRDKFGLEHVTLQQFVNGVPVFDGVVKLHFNKNNELAVLNGNNIRIEKLKLTPAISQNEAASVAINYVETQRLAKGKVGSNAPLRVNKNTLYIFQKGLAQGYNGAKHLVYEVEIRNDADVREFLYIDAHTSELVEQFTGIHAALNRKLYTYPPGSTTSTTPTLTWSEGDPFPGGMGSWQQSEIVSAGHIYHLMQNAFGRDSYDGSGASMITTHNNPDIDCPNANWNGASANYCDNIAADDVVAHEWGHAYTEYTSGLIYAWQAGALNEAYSDIWGETVDLLNNYFDVAEGTDLRDPNGTDNPAMSVSSRWRMGEKASADTTSDASLRDMYNPNSLGYPGRVLDPNYWCKESDAGGVHINSSVLNHSYALLVDGGIYNGQTINGIGLTKAAHIYWYAQANFMNRTTDFAAQADILEASAQALIDLGTELPKLSVLPGDAGGSGQFLTHNDLLELQKVLLAVELRSENTCGFATILQPVDPLCEGASPSLALFSEDFETGLGSFTTSVQTASTSWVTRNWEQVPAPGGRSGNVAFGVDYAGGDCASSNQQGIIRLESPLINIPAGTAGNLHLVFDHYLSTEQGWDGGNIKYSLNGGTTWTLLPASAFTANPYNGTLISSSVGSNNPLQGQAAFTGTDAGSVGGSWGQSQINLSSIGLVAGGNIKLRWEMGTDCAYGYDGWYIDNVRVYTCSVTPAVHFASDGSEINEGAATIASGCSKYVDKVVTVQIDKAPSQPVQVTFTLAGSTAKEGATSDFTISPASVTLDAVNLTQNVTVRVYDDAYIEGEETVNLGYTLNTNGGDGYAGSEYQTYALTIVDNDLAPGNYTEELLSANFDNGPRGWRVINGGTYNNTWTISAYSNAGLDGFSNPFFFSQGGASTSFTKNEVLISPSINTAGKKNLVLEFSQDWYPISGGTLDQGIVSVWDGSAWQVLLTQSEGAVKGDILSNDPDVQLLAIPDAYANLDMKIKFQYVAGNNGWWAIDNVKVKSSNSTTILTSTNSAVGSSNWCINGENKKSYCS